MSENTPTPKKDYRTALKTLFEVNKLSVQNYPGYIVIILVMTIVISALPYAFSFIQGEFVDHLVLVTSNSTAEVFKKLYVILGLFVGVYLAQEVFAVMLGFFDYRFRTKFTTLTRLMLLEKKSELNIADYDDSNTWSRLIRATEGQEPMNTLFWNQNNMIKQFIGIILGVIVVAQFSLVALLIVLVITIPAAWVNFSENGAHYKQWIESTDFRKKLDYLWGLFRLEKSIVEIKFAQISKKIIGLWYKERIEQVEKPIYEVQNKYTPLNIVVSIFSAAGYFAVFYILANKGISGEISVGKIIFYMSSIFSLSGTFSGLLSSIGANYQTILKVNEFTEFLKIKSIVKDGDVVPSLLQHPPVLTIKDLYFGYQDKKVLKGVSAIIKPGEKIAIVGLNGAGKTTLIKMITKVYNPDSGSIKINEHDLEDLASSWWYGHLGVLSQEYTNYSFTVEESIAVGSSEPMNEDRVIESAKLAQIHDTIMELPLGYKTQLGRQFKDGHNFSIGQWQKLAIARALYRKPKVLILDEPTSAVDAEAEEAIFNNLHDLSKETTLIFVSHRFSTIRRADRILLVSDGQITEQGTHEDLMKMNGEYSRLFILQAKSYQ